MNDNQPTPAPSPERMTLDRRAEIDRWADKGLLPGTPGDLLAELAAVEAERDFRALSYEMMKRQRDALRARLPTPEMVRAAAEECDAQVTRWNEGETFLNDADYRFARIIAAALKVDMSPAAPTKEIES